MRLEKLREVRVKAYFDRILLGAVISPLAELLVSAAGPYFGRMFRAFPAILPSSLTLKRNEAGGPQGRRRHPKRDLAFAPLHCWSKGRCWPEPFLAIGLALVVRLVVSWLLSALSALGLPKPATGDLPEPHASDRSAFVGLTLLWPPPASQLLKLFAQTRKR
jgi:hypothetical protein